MSVCLGASHIHHPLVFPVALALREQALAADQVPVGASDVPVDVIVTPDETISADSNSGT
jgi:5-formyltetrahydrofolate cyclo-ligase